ncbi:MAG: amidohydrolase family protein [Lachnospirales bacterium]
MNVNEEKYDIVIKDGTYLNSQLEISHSDFIGIKNGKISYIGDANCKGDTVLNGDGRLYMCGMVDGHTHTSQQLLRGRLLDEKPVIWKRINVPFEAQLNEETSTLSAELCALEMIKNGTTGFLDAGGKYVPEFAKVYKKSGLRGRLSYMTNDNPAMPSALRIEVKEGLKRQIELYEDLKGSLLEGVFSVTALTAASEEMIRTIFSYAKENNISAQVHMNEYASEVFDFIEKYSLRPIEWLAKENLISEKFTAAHGIFLSQEEMNIIKEKNIKVMHCPFSNCGKGIPPTPQLLAQGTKVGFGTDGSAHGGVDIFKEIRLFRGVMNSHHGILSGDPQIMPAKTLLKMATHGGSAVLDVEGLGLFSVGSPADIISIKTDAPHILPTQNLVNSLVESVSGSDVQDSIINGRLVMKDRIVLTLDEEKIMEKAKKYIISGEKIHL